MQAYAQSVIQEPGLSAISLGPFLYLLQHYRLVRGLCGYGHLYIRVYVLFVGDELAGACFVINQLENGITGAFGYPGNLLILPRFRGRGLGGILLGEVMRKEAALGRSKFFMDIDSENQAAFRTYSALELVTTGVGLDIRVGETSVADARSVSMRGISYATAIGFVEGNVPGLSAADELGCPSGWLRMILRRYGVTTTLKAILSKGRMVALVAEREHAGGIQRFVRPHLHWTLEDLSEVMMASRSMKNLQSRGPISIGLEVEASRRNEAREFVQSIGLKTFGESYRLIKTVQGPRIQRIGL